MSNKSLFLPLGMLAAMACPLVAQEAGNDQAALIRQEIQQMRQEYEARIKQMETRIAELEQEQKAVASAPAAPAAAASQSVPPHSHIASSGSSSGGAKAGIASTDVVVPEGFKFEDVTKGFTFNGYFRAGYGVNSEGDTMEAFKAPGAGSKYRLGNEAETYVETDFGYTFPELDLSPGTEFAVHFMPAFVLANSRDDARSDISVRQAYGTAKGVWDAQPEAMFWAGQRYYDRFDVHMTDFYYLDMSGFGGGVEGIDLGIGKLAVAWFGGSIDDYSSDASEVLKETNNKNSLDIRLSDIDVPGGKGMVWLDLAHSDDLSRPNGNNVNVDSSTGAAVGLLYETDVICGGRSRTMVQYGVGAAGNFRSTQADYSFLSLPDDMDPALEVDPDDAWHFRLTQDIIYQPNESWGMQGTFVWDEVDVGSAADSRNSWISGGARAQYNLNDYFSLALEAGVDHVDTFDGVNGNLYKVTFAPQITPGRDVMSRPALRLFATYATWDDDLEGFVAPTSYGMDTDGFSFGVQVEAWW
ncbi:carbohydrate porin [Verrucomicrobiaceae bacterium N1E253]|uniref:Carbohydrate porin n=1 Tax=Oceaniferula marina TaxID=2748318 RepID=A0A851GK12_9BACT|nr:carbohydrate porin [Oceaniferula marina]NWK57676.1 carbohydrate porin [Oceaniferula marina]